jgi:hypothetical protein
MSKAAVDVLIEIRFNVKEPEKTVIYTNARKDNDAVEEILSTWVRSQIGQGGDLSERVEREVYTVKIGLILEDDSFCSEADTGNKGLTCGIVMDVLQNLKHLTVKNLADRPKDSAEATA